jgi:hypothetical protein
MSGSDFDSPNDRGTGRTSEQMRNAPQGAFYVWCNHHLGYPRTLAERLGRKDLKIVSNSWLNGDSWLGRRGYKVVIDHATVIQPSRIDAVAYMRSRGIIE